MFEWNEFFSPKEMNNRFRNFAIIVASRIISSIKNGSKHSGIKKKTFFLIKNEM